MELTAIKNDVVNNETNQKTSHNNESYQFVNFTDVVRNLTSPVLLTTTNYGFLDLLLNLLFSIQRLSIQPMILILCEDKTVYVELLKRQSNFSLKYHLALTHLQESGNDAFGFSTTGYISLVKKRISYIEILLQRDLDVFYIDSDVVLLADPFKYFTDDNVDIFFQWDRNNACTGFFYIKANRTTKAFVTKWAEAMPGDQFGNQRAFNRAMRRSGEELKVYGLPKNLFMSGYEFRNSGKAWYLMSPQPVQIHANFIRGEGSKVDWLKKHELWLVNV
ncbi:UDP-D-xylose:L-fucose alpha-1,3-D-xylosyltransferase 3 [Holothuria leucospilota]|uniref:UDP-D-xylose:L-fucose alpha-1,3-D-xylosyltransferase 3 n=1 Tax=Holothuria leucospilota TaxID=206669 RepID=A0A9Q1HHT4_HOLLE|nr:UDP-D-xylose:L-fucose alpha-1,3-D-xylosyltransferase 3 [Holothuria leucospilota]